MSYYAVGGDVEDGWRGSGAKLGLDPSYEFAERAVRLGFIRKVFGILSVQLLVTVGVITAFVVHPPLVQYVAANPWTLWGTLGLTFALVLIMGCSVTARRAHPWNVILLGSFTLCESVLLGVVSASTDPMTVLLAAGITTVVVLSLTLFTLQTKMDFTAASGTLFACLMVLMVAIVAQAFLQLPWLNLAVSVGGALVFSVYLVFDIQLLMGGGMYAISPDEHVFAALNLYLDIINIFLYILRILNELNRQ